MEQKKEELIIKKQGLIADLGSGYFKVGTSFDKEPHLIFPSLYFQ